MSVGFVTTAGLADVIAAWAGGSFFLQCGTGSGQTTSGTDLVAPAGTRQAATNSQVTTNVTDDTLRLEATFLATAAAAISEVGIFDSSTGANLFVYGDFTAINLANGDSIVFQVNITVSST